jgi:protein-S-isoprenylcysteine O-methyltransferase Ste14
MVTITTVAFIVYVVFGLITIVGRPWLHFRQTGDTGIRGLAAGTGPAPALVKVLFSVAVFAVPVALLANLFDLPLSARLIVSVPLHLTGLVVMIVGGVLVSVAQTAMGASWRIGIDEHERTTLVTTGPFAVVRHPIHAAVSVFLLGLVLAVPNTIAVVGTLAWVAGMEVHVRALEEPTLLRLHGNLYKSYAQRVGRFAPRVGRF